MKSDLQRFNESGAYRIARTERRKTGEYANVLIASSQKGNWYDDLIGIECFCLLIFQDSPYGRYLRDARVVQLKNTQIVLGRCLNPIDIIIV